MADVDRIEDLSIPELESMAIRLKSEEQAYLEQMKTDKRAIRDELLRRAERDYARQRLVAAGVEDPSDEMIQTVIDSNERKAELAREMRENGDHVVVEVPTLHGVMEAN